MKQAAATRPGAANGSDTTSTRQPRERPLIRRRSLPGGRAVVAAFLIAASAVATFSAYTSATSKPRQLYVVAARSIPIGTRLAAADLRLVPLDLPDAGVRSEVFGSTAPLLGASVLAPITSGALVEASAVVGRAGAQGTREVSVSIDRARAVAGTLKAGEYVDVLGTFGNGPDAYTAVMVAHVRVIALSNISSSFGDQRTQLITFAPPTELAAEALADAAVAAQVTLVRSAETAVEPTGNPTTANPGEATPPTPAYRAPGGPSTRGGA